MCISFILRCSVYSTAQNKSEVSNEKVKFILQITVKYAGTFGGGGGGTFTPTYTYHLNIIILSIVRSPN